MVRVLGYVGAHYEVHDMEMAKVYRWRPASVVVECKCGQTPTLTSSTTTCVGCGADHTDVIAEVLENRMVENEERHPWHSLRSYFTSKNQCYP